MTQFKITDASSLRITDEVPVLGSFDVCVVGGGPAGVFAAVRAARLGATVCLVEQLSALGGTSAMAQVNEWHSIHDISGEERIVGGLIYETIERLRARRALREYPPGERIEFRFNSAELSIELDLLVHEAGVRLLLCSTLTDVVLEDEGRVEAIVLGDISGRRAVRARQFIDASGNGALISRAGLLTHREREMQPVSHQFMISGLDELRASAGYEGSLWEAVRDLRDRRDHPESDPWINRVPHATDVHNVMGARLNGVDATDPDQLTSALREGRRLSRAFIDLLRDRFGSDADPVTLLSFAPLLGIRQTRQVLAQHRLTELDLMSGEHFSDSIAVGVYPVDVHSTYGTVLRYLNGWEDRIGADGTHRERRRWRDPGESSPPFYCIPFRSILPLGSHNALVAGRLVDATADAYGAVRVVVVCAQFGEAAGIAAALAVRDDSDISRIDVREVQHLLRSAGTALPMITQASGGQDQS